MNLQYDYNDSKMYCEYFDTNYKKLFFFAKSLIGDKEEARDILGESFIKLLEKKNQFSNMAHLQVYFHAIIKNACIDYLRKDKFRTIVENKLKQTEILTENVIERRFQEAELRKLLYNRINQLPKRMKQIFKLTYLEGYSRMKVARMLNLSENTIRNTNAAAMKTLKISISSMYM